LAWVTRSPLSTGGLSCSRTTSRTGWKHAPAAQLPVPPRRLQRKVQLRWNQSTLLSDVMLPFVFDATPLIVVGVALGLGVAAQGFINQMLEGDQGLGAYLRDGSGYNKSGFRTKRKQSNNNRNSAAQSDVVVDPLPWLKLPKLDFVDVAGQESVRSEVAMLETLESLRLEMNTLLDQGKIEDATLVRAKLEAIMDEAGVEYKI
jgi:hypothetical protein